MKTVFQYKDDEIWWEKIEDILDTGGSLAALGGNGHPLHYPVHKQTRSKEKKHGFIGLRILESDRELIVAAAYEAGVTLSAFIREAALIRVHHPFDD